MAICRIIATRLPRGRHDHCHRPWQEIESPLKIRIRFNDLGAKKRALGRLAGRYPFRSWATGEMLVPEAALGLLATENVPFQIEGPATYEQMVWRPVVIGGPNPGLATIY